MRAFEYARPTSVDQALDLLRRDGDGAIRPLAGGTDLLTLMKADIAEPEQLVDIKRVAGLDDRVGESADGLTLGALATLAQIEMSELIQHRYTALWESVALAATPQLRNMATIGGNLLQRPRCWYFRSRHFTCWLKAGDHCPAKEGENQLHALFGDGPCYAVHPSDPAAALLALRAEARLRGPAGERTVPLSELFALPSDDRRTETTVRGDELLLSIRIPLPADGARSTYLKAMDRKVWAFALVGVAAVLRQRDGRVDEAGLVLSGVAPVPWRAAAAEQVLVGGEVGPELFARAAEAALADAQPLEHNGYKLPLAKALVRRALETLSAPAAS